MLASSGESDHTRRRCLPTGSTTTATGGTTMARGSKVTGGTTTPTGGTTTARGSRATFHQNQSYPALPETWGWSGSTRLGCQGVNCGGMGRFWSRHGFPCQKIAWPNVLY